MITNRKEALNIVGGLSEPSKLPCHGYSLPAEACKMGAILAKNKNSICNKCYAKRGHYMYKNVINALAVRLEAIRKPEWVEAMTFLIMDMRYFRWHDSGDIQDTEHLQKIVDVAKNTPDTKHWLPTREYKIVSDYVREYGAFPENLIVRLSAATFEKNPPINLAKSLGVLTSGASKTEYNCPAYSQGNQCGSCRKCWDKNEPNIIYKRH